jgi:hypothetical protein
MITEFEPTHPLEPENNSHFQVMAALGAGIVAGIILLIVPRGSPWSSLTFFAPVIVGRVVPMNLGLAPGIVALIHMGLAIADGFIISLVVMHLTRIRAVLVGGLIGLVLYLINYGVVSAWFPGLQGNEVSVVFTHFVFGLISAGVYRGLLRRKVTAVPPNL